MSEKKYDFSKTIALAVKADGTIQEIARNAEYPDKAVIVISEPSWFGDDKISIMANGFAEMTKEQASAVWTVVSEGADFFCETSSDKDVEAKFASYKLGEDGIAASLTFPKGKITNAEKVAADTAAWIKDHVKADKPASDKGKTGGSDDTSDTGTKGKKPAKADGIASYLAAVDGMERSSDAYKTATKDWVAAFLDED